MLSNLIDCIEEVNLFCIQPSKILFIDEAYLTLTVGNSSIEQLLTFIPFGIVTPSRGYLLIPTCSKLSACRATPYDIRLNALRSP